MLQKFAAVHASIHNHFNKDRHLNRRDIFKQTFFRPGRVASAGGLNASDQRPTQARSGLSDNAIHAAVYNVFNTQRHLISRRTQRVSRSGYADMAPSDSRRVNR